MTSKAALSRNVLQLAVGEIPARLCGIATVLLLARFRGVVELGIYALAQSMTMYCYLFIDFGLRHVGARLIAQYPTAARLIVRQVQNRRFRMGSALIPLILLYSFLADVPPRHRIFLFLFSATSCLYALSLEWAAWGMEKILLIGISRILVPGAVLLFLVAALSSSHLLTWLVIGNISGYGLQAVLFLAWYLKSKLDSAESSLPSSVEAELAWRQTAIMGMAWVCNLAFNSIDMLMLGVMSGPRQVGLYSAAYRVLNQVLVTYYLFTQVLYPRLARQDKAQRHHMIQFKVLLFLLIAGVGIAIFLISFGNAIMMVGFGDQFAAAIPLMFLLAWAVPLDFLTSYLSNAYIAWGMEKNVLICTALAATSNIILNLFSLRQHGAIAAASNTLISYFVFIGALSVVARRVKQRDPLVV